MSSHITLCRYFGMWHVGNRVRLFASKFSPPAVSNISDLNHEKVNTNSDMGALNHLYYSDIFGQRFTVSSS